MKNKNRKNGLKVILLLGIFLFSGSMSAFSQVCGDVNNSGSVDIVDALLTAQYYVGMSPSPFNPGVADVNGSGSIDIVDALVTAQYYVGIVSSLSCTVQTPAPTVIPSATAVPGTGTVYSSSGGKFLKDGSEIKLFGLNWFGMETTDHVLHGLWTGRQLADFLSDFKSKGFTALRLPVSPETINSGYAISSGPYSGDDCTAVCGKDGRAALEYALLRTQEAGMYVLLDFHTCSPASLGSGLPGSPTACSGYSSSSWIADLKTMATLSKTYTNVIGIDLTNEPWNLSYSAWAGLASQGGQAVLSVNPNVTIWVEGVGNNSATGGYGANWGQNLYEAGAISGIPSNRLVFTPHSYGPSISAMDYFSASNYPDNMPTIWDNFFGHLVGQGYTVVVGEFGGKYTTSSTKSQDDKLWQDSFVTYLISKGMKNSFYWCVNPNSGDTGGLYGDDWKTWNNDKVTLLQRLMK
jgi:endoglucanase